MRLESELGKEARTIPTGVLQALSCSRGDGGGRGGDGDGDSGGGGGDRWW